MENKPMTDPTLSPAAQAVLDAYIDEDRAGRLAVAAALRAAADQCTYQDAWDDKFLSAEKLLAIAAELAGTTTTPDES
jgi:hypothetical protein